jgi:hypothetical protein
MRPCPASGQSPKVDALRPPPPVVALKRRSLDGLLSLRHALFGKWRNIHALGSNGLNVVNSDEA